MSLTTAAPPVGSPRARPVDPRLDWRFLLEDPRLLEVTVAGPPLAQSPDESLRDAVDGLALDATTAMPYEAGAGSRAVVLHEPRPDFGAIAGLVPPGGFAWIELRQTPGSIARSTVHRWERGLRAAGFTTVEPYWVWPSHAAPLELTPLGDRGAVRLALSRRSTRAGARVRAGVGSVLVGMGVFGRMAPSVALVAGRDDGTTRGTTGRLGAVLAGLDRDRARLGLADHGLTGELSGVMLTPRFEASGHIVLLVTALGDDRPRVVAKVHRLPAPGPGLLREVESLEALRKLDLPAGTVPSFLGWLDIAGHPALVQSALPGAAIDPNAIRRDRHGIVAAVDATLRRLVRPGLEPVPGVRFDREIEAPIERLAAVLTDNRDQARLGFVRRSIEPLARAELPVAFEHGDVAHPNLLQGPGGGVSLIDWELGTQDGLPLQDLVFFLAHVAFAERRPSTEAEHARLALEASRLDGWAGPILLTHAAEIGVDPALVPALVVTTWTRYLDGHIARRADGAVAGRFLGIWRGIVDGLTPTVRA